MFKFKNYDFFFYRVLNFKIKCQRGHKIFQAFLLIFKSVKFFFSKNV